MPNITGLNSVEFAQTWPDVAEYLMTDHAPIAMRQHFVAQGNTLTADQALEMRRRIEEMVAISPDSPALVFDALEIPNGEYTVTRRGEYSETFNFRVHLVQDGSLSGQRIVKVKRNDGIYRGFAFVTKAGGFSLWRRFEREADEEYVTVARIALSAIGDWNRTFQAHSSQASTRAQWAQRPFTLEMSDVTYAVTFQHRCTRCNAEVDFDGGEGDCDITPLVRCSEHVVRLVDRPRAAMSPAREPRLGARTMRDPTTGRSLLLCENGSGEIR